MASSCSRDATTWRKQAAGGQAHEKSCAVNPISCPSLLRIVASPSLYLFPLFSLWFFLWVTLVAVACFRCRVHRSYVGIILRFMISSIPFTMPVVVVFLFLIPQTSNAQRRSVFLVLPALHTVYHLVSSCPIHPSIVSYRIAFLLFS